MLVELEELLPPHYVRLGEGQGYLNTMTNTTTSDNPIVRFLQLKEQFSTKPQKVDDSPPADHDVMTGIDDTAGATTLSLSPTEKPASVEAKDIPEYKCQWSERDLFGKVNLYSLFIRYYANQTIVKFDGIDGEWIYSNLKGPYGLVEQEDLFIGAKVTVFGRHLSISSINTAATKWIAKTEKILRKQQEAFCGRIESVNAIPCVKKTQPTASRNITRENKGIGNCNLRKLKNENARLGEQIASLGLAQLM